MLDTPCVWPYAGQYAGWCADRSVYRPIYRPVYRLSCIYSAATACSACPAFGLLGMRPVVYPHWTLPHYSSFGQTLRYIIFSRSAKDDGRSGGSPVSGISRRSAVAHDRLNELPTPVPLRMCLFAWNVLKSSEKLLLRKALQASLLWCSCFLGWPVLVFVICSARPCSNSLRFWSSFSSQFSLSQCPRCSLLESLSCASIGDRIPIPFSKCAFGLPQHLQLADLRKFNLKGKLGSPNSFVPSFFATFCYLLINLLLGFFG